MNRISLASTKFYTSAFPFLSFGMLLIVVLSFVLSGEFAKFPLVLIPLCGAIALCFAVYVRLIWGVVDLVHECGGFLDVTKNGKTVRIHYADIESVDVSYRQIPTKVILRMRGETTFGRTIAFFPKRNVSLNPFRGNDIATSVMAKWSAIRSDDGR